MKIPSWLRVLTFMLISLLPAVLTYLSFFRVDYKTFPSMSLVEVARIVLSLSVSGIFFYFFYWIYFLKKEIKILSWMLNHKSKAAHEEMDLEYKELKEIGDMKIYLLREGY